MTTKFDEFSDRLGMNSRIEVAKFEPGPKFEKTFDDIKDDIIDIKDNHLKSTASSATNIPAITSFEENFDPLIMNGSFELEKIKPEPTFENTINKIKDNNMKNITSAETNLSDITSFDDNFYSLSMKNSFEAEMFKPELTFEKTINEIKANNLKTITSIEMNVLAINLNKPSLSYEHLKYDFMPWILLQSLEE